MRHSIIHFAIIHIVTKILAWPVDSLGNVMSIRVHYICHPLPLLVGRDSGELDGVGLGPGLDVGAGVLESTEQTLLGVDGLGSVDGVDVLDESHLVASGRTLASDDGRVGKEELPDLCRDMVSIRHGRHQVRTQNLRGTICCRTWQQPCHGWPSSCGTTSRE